MERKVSTMKEKKKKIISTVLMCLLIQYILDLALTLLIYFGVITLTPPLYAGIGAIASGFLYMAFRKLKKCQDPVIQKVLTIMAILFISIGVFYVLITIILF